MQSSWPASSTAQDHFKLFAERVEKLSGGQLKIEAMAAGQVVPAFEVLDASSKKVIDGMHSISYYWVGKNNATVLFAGPPGGPFGMDHSDYLSWMWGGGGTEMWNDLYQNTLKLNVHVMPGHPTSPQAFGWFKRPIKSLADFKTMKCRQTGINAQIFTRMGMTTINLPGGEILPAAQRGVIDCAEWVGGIEDLRLGLHTVYKFHYTPGMHENNTMGEIVFNGDVWKSFSPLQQEIIRSAARDAHISWYAAWQKQNADALKEMQEKHGVKVLRTPPEILIAYLKAWDGFVEEESAKNPVFKKVLDSQKAWAEIVVPAKRFMHPPYSFAANYYWPEGKAADAKKK
jgi:TRAP-type mannitol/chloroaromatic compound transport system substrate-binding protein